MKSITVKVEGKVPGSQAEGEMKAHINDGKGYCRDCGDPMPGGVRGEPDHTFERKDQGLYFSICCDRPEAEHPSPVSRVDAVLDEHLPIGTFSADLRGKLRAEISLVLASHAEEAVKARDQEWAYHVNGPMMDYEGVTPEGTGKYLFEWREREKADAVKAATEELRVSLELTDKTLALERQAREKAEKELAASEARSDQIHAAGYHHQERAEKAEKERDKADEVSAFWHDKARDKAIEIARLQRELDAALAEVERLKKSQSWLEQYQYALGAYSHVCDENAALVKRVAELERDAVALFEYGAMTRADLRAGLREISAIGQEQACYADNAALRKRVEDEILLHKTTADLVKMQDAEIESLRKRVVELEAKERLMETESQEEVVLILERARREGAEAFREQAAKYITYHSNSTRSTSELRRLADEIREMSIDLQKSNWMPPNTTGNKAVAEPAPTKRRSVYSHAAPYAATRCEHPAGSSKETVLSSLPIDPPKATHFRMNEEGVPVGRDGKPCGCTVDDHALEPDPDYGFDPPKAEKMPAEWGQVVAEAQEQGLYDPETERPMTRCAVAVEYPDGKGHPCGTPMPCPTHYPDPPKRSHSDECEPNDNGGMDCVCGLGPAEFQQLRDDPPKAEPTTTWRGEWCNSCNRRNPVGFKVTDAEWAAVSQGRWNVLCLTCFDEEAELAGVRYETLSLYEVAWYEWADSELPPKEKE